MRRGLGRAGLVAAILALCLALAPAASAAPPQDAASWLAGELGPPGEQNRCEAGAFTYGLITDCNLAFAAAGLGTQRAATYSWLLANKSAYVGSQPCSTATTLSAGAVAKLAVVVEANGGDPRNVGGRDLLADLVCLQELPGEAGRFKDKGGFDFSNVFGQALAVIALRACEVNCSGSPSYAAAIAAGSAYLRAQQCAGGEEAMNGAFRSPLGLSPTACNRNPSFEPGPPPVENLDSVEVDSTAVAAQALWLDGTGESTEAAVAALEWLVGEEVPSGSPSGTAWQSYCDFGEPTALLDSANSTGLTEGAYLRPAEEEAELDFEAGREWLEGVVAAQPAESKGLPSCTASGTPDVRATAQGMLGLFPTSYAELAGL